MTQFDTSKLVTNAAGQARTADCVVFAPDDDQAGQWKVLLITRGSEPWKGKRAFPGGFMDADLDDRPGDAAARELMEETGLSVQAPPAFADEQPPSELLTGRLTWLNLYDAEGRDPRMPVATDAYVAVLDEEPSVAGADDASHAAFYPVESIMEELRVAPEGEQTLAADHDLIFLDALELLRQFDADPTS